MVFILETRLETLKVFTEKVRSPNTSTNNVGKGKKIVKKHFFH
jgi:hypothetical protein